MNQEQAPNPAVADAEKSLSYRDPRVAEHVAAEMKPFIDRAIEARDEKDALLAGAEYLGEEKITDHSAIVRKDTFDAAARAADKEIGMNTLAEGVGNLKEAELTKNPLPEKKLTIQDIEAGSIVKFNNPDAPDDDTKQQKAMILAVRDGAVDYIGIDKQSENFGVADTKTLEEAGLSNSTGAVTTGEGLRIPPAFHDKEEASNQLALLQRIDETQQKYDAQPDHEPSLEGLATEALAEYTVNGQQAASFQKDLKQTAEQSNVIPISEPQPERKDLAA